MIFINEWLPNPNGADAKGEFIELYNNGNALMNLSGWVLKTSGKKSFSLSGRSIAANGYLVLERTETKLSLKNTGEAVFLYNADGNLVDQSSYLGQAPSGQSFARIYYPMGENSDAQPQSFVWGSPTPGAANKITLNNSIAVNSYPFNTALNVSPGGAAILGMSFGLGIILSALVIYCVKRDENVSKLFFARDSEVR